MRPELAEIYGDPVLGPRFEKALGSPHWETAISARSIRPDRWKIRIRKFKPSRRVSFTVEIPSRNGSERSRFLVKVWHSPRGESIRERLELINSSLDREAKACLRIPSPLFYDSEAHALAYRWMPGVPLSRRLRQGDPSNWIDSVAKALSFLHQLSLPDLPQRSPLDEIDAVTRSLDPDTPEAFRADLSIRILDPLLASPPKLARQVSLHRDLYDQQALLTGKGPVTLIDLDDMARGDPMLDVGNLMAHLHLIEKVDGGLLDVTRIEKKFLKAYAIHAGLELGSIGGPYLWYKTVSLARLAALQLKKRNRKMSRRLFLLAERARKSL